MILAWASLERVNFLREQAGTTRRDAVYVPIYAVIRFRRFARARSRRGGYRGESALPEISVCRVQPAGLSAAERGHDMQISVSGHFPADRR